MSHPEGRLEGVTHLPKEQVVMVRHTKVKQSQGDLGEATKSLSLQFNPVPVGHTISVPDKNRDQSSRGAESGHREFGLPGFQPSSHLLPRRMLGAVEGWGGGGRGSRLWTGDM